MRRCDRQNSPIEGLFLFLDYTSAYMAGGVRWHTTKFGLRSGVIGIRRRATFDDITQAMGVGEAICTMREIIAVVDRPKDIEDEEAMSFFGGSEGDADESQG